MNKVSTALEEGLGRLRLGLLGSGPYPPLAFPTQALGPPLVFSLVPGSPCAFSGLSLRLPWALLRKASQEETSATQQASPASRQKLRGWEPVCTLCISVSLHLMPGTSHRTSHLTPHTSHLTPPPLRNHCDSNSHSASLKRHGRVLHLPVMAQEQDVKVIFINVCKA